MGGGRKPVPQLRKCSSPSRNSQDPTCQTAGSELPPTAAGREARPLRRCPSFRWYAPGQSHSAPTRSGRQDPSRRTRLALRPDVVSFTRFGQGIPCRRRRSLCTRLQPSCFGHRWPRAPARLLERPHCGAATGGAATGKAMPIIGACWPLHKLPQSRFFDEDSRFEGKSRSVEPAHAPGRTGFPG